ncbi:hypothetical protein ABW19_dt0202571 [Dactylella cylindrospora]|nr:hypothetical protein ABW19_dt0202571 [Dactylella cylindrospora]
MANMQPPPETPKYRFPSPDEDLRPRSGPPKFNLSTQQPNSGPPVANLTFATPAPPPPRLQQDVNLGVSSSSRLSTSFGPRNRGFSPDPDLFTPRQPVRPGTADASRGKRRRSFDLGEIDEDLMVGKPKVLGPSSSGFKYPTSFLSATPVAGKSTQLPTGNLGYPGVQATPTPVARNNLLIPEGSIILSSPPQNLNLSFGDTQEDVQDDSGSESKNNQVVSTPVRKKRKATGVFDDIESIASSLPPQVEQIDEEESGSGENSGGEDEARSRSRRHLGTSENDDSMSTPRARRQEKVTLNRSNARPKSKFPRDPRTPPRMFQSYVSDIAEGEIAIVGTAQQTKQWIAVPDRPQFNLPPVSPTAKLNKAICAMAWSPSHRKRRNANSKYLTGGLASTVLGWAFDAQDSVLRNNAAMEQTPHLHNGAYIVDAEELWEEENYVAVVGDAEYQSQDKELAMQQQEEDREGWKARVILIADANSGLRKNLKRRARVEVRAPTWEITAMNGDTWTVAINWNIRAAAASNLEA